MKRLCCLYIFATLLAYELLSGSASAKVQEFRKFTTLNDKAQQIEATEENSKMVSLGKDLNDMTWYIIDYGKDVNGIPFAISRKYYTNLTIKNETIELLISKYGISKDKAEGLYFSEYGYEYTPDGKQFATTYVSHYDMFGNEIHRTVYDGSSEDTKKVYINLSEVPNSVPAKAASYALKEDPQSNTGSSGGGGCNSGTLALCAMLSAIPFFKKK